MPIHSTITNTTIADRLRISGGDRVTLDASDRIAIVNSVGVGQDPNCDFAPAYAGFPSTPRTSFAVRDGWQLPVFDRLTLNGTARASLPGRARLIVLDFGPRSQIVLSSTNPNTGR